MKKYIKISRYHIGIVCTYIILVPLIWYVSPGVFNFRVPTQNIDKVITLILMSILGFSVYSYLFKRKEIKISLNKLFRYSPFLLVYAIFFALPEEIIFRGVIQNYFQTQMWGTVSAIVYTSLIFGVAHLPNGAKGKEVYKWNWQFAMIAFFGGLFFGEAFVLTGTLLVPTIMHTFFSFLLFVRAVPKHEKTKN